MAGEQVIRDGHEAYRMEYTWFDPRHNRQSRSLHVFVKQGVFVYSLLALTGVELYDNYERIFETMLASFKMVSR